MAKLNHLQKMYLLSIQDLTYRETVKTEMLKQNSVFKLSKILSKEEHNQKRINKLEKAIKLSKELNVDFAKFEAEIKQIKSILPF